MTLSDWIAGGFREVKSWFKPVDVVKLAEDSYNQLAETADLGNHPPMKPGPIEWMSEIRPEDLYTINELLGVLDRLVASGNLTYEELTRQLSVSQQKLLAEYRDKGFVSVDKYQ